MYILIIKRRLFSFYCSFIKLYLNLFILLKLLTLIILGILKYNCLLYNYIRTLSFFMFFYLFKIYFLLNFYDYFSEQNIKNQKML